ncbi:CoA pyrophosphatase [Cellulomonas sp. 179-A 4D5 NHS]|uniref:NUDIX hydrolase n=1 Tax=Cellulomonas sp. 179-A 4D5 NHS TaxID=3142378 RepID=UPI00399F76BD
MSTSRADEPAGAPAGVRDQLQALCARTEPWPRVPWHRTLDPATARHSAVLVLFGVLDGVPAHAGASAVPRDVDVLLTRRSDTVGHHPGQVSFPGGGIDPGDDGPVGAALREAQEETGLDPGGVEVLGSLPALPVAVSNNLVTPVLAWWARPSAVAATDPAETVHVFRAPVADLLDPARRRTSTLTRGGTTYRGPAFLVDDHVVWGFTAHVLDGVFEALGWTQPWDAARTVAIRA